MDIQTFKPRRSYSVELALNMAGIMSRQWNRLVPGQKLVERSALASSRAPSARLGDSNT